MHGDDGVERVRLLGEHGLRFELFGESDEVGDLALEIGFDLFAFLGEIEVGLDVIGEAFAFAHERLGARGVGPDGGVGDLFFEGG